MSVVDSLVRPPVAARRDYAAPRSIRILVTSAGRRVELVNCFRAAAEQLGVDAVMVACDLRPEASAACRIADRAFRAPPADSAGYADTLLDQCRHNAIDLVVPTIDTELMALATARATFAEAGIGIAVSDPAVIGIVRDKLETAAFFERAGLPAPRTATAEHVLAAPGDWSWPVFAKPRGGSAGRGAGVAASPVALAARTAEPMIVQELLEGREFTVNIFIDRDGILRCAVPHERLQVRAGEVEKGVTRVVPCLTDLAQRLAAALPGARGPLCFQAMVDATGAASLFEINARFGGGYPLTDHAGGTFARWLIEERLGLPCSANDGWREGVTMLRYDAAVFVPS